MHILHLLREALAEMDQEIEKEAAKPQTEEQQQKIAKMRWARADHQQTLTQWEQQVRKEGGGGRGTLAKTKICAQKCTKFS